jgi:hypothetical protein
LKLGKNSKNTKRDLLEAGGIKKFKDDLQVIGEQPLEIE